jgi:1-acyl-sn-glycerol-3-phosphate acyltransferase
MIRNVFARVWALWGLLSFVITFLIFFFPSMLAHLIKDPKKSQSFFIQVSRVWMRVWLFLVGCPVRITGRENFREGKNYIVVFNHNALLDVPLSAPFVEGANKTIAKASFARVPIFGAFYRKGAILVDRKNEKSRIRSYEEMKRILAMGIHMCIYPEGTRNRTKEPIKQFYDGAFKLSVETGKEILPCIITGTKKAMPIDQTFFLLPTRLGMEFLPSISPAGKTSKGLKEEVFQLMTARFVATNNISNR